MNSISSRILKLVKDQNLSYADLSALTNIPKTALYRYATGRTDKIPSNRLDLIAKALHVTPAYLAGWESEPQNEESKPTKSKDVVSIASSAGIAYNKNVFAANLIRLMQQNGEKKTDIAKLLKVSKSTVSDYCKGKLMPRMDKIKILSAYYGTTISELLEPQQSLDHCLNRAPLVPCKNTVRITSRDGSSIEKALSDEQAAALKVIIEQLPEFHSTFEMS